MKCFLDTANRDDLRKAVRWGVVDGVTTNPTRIARDGRPFEEHIREITEIVDGGIGAGVVSSEAGQRVRDGREPGPWDRHRTGGRAYWYHAF